MVGGFDAKNTAIFRRQRSFHFTYLTQSLSQVVRTSLKFIERELR